MKRVIPALFAFILVMGFGTEARCALIIPMDPVKFYLVDTDGDDEVVLDINSWEPTDPNLQYKTAGGSWTDAAPVQAFNISSSDGYLATWWKIDTVVSGEDENGVVGFVGQFDSSSTLFHGLWISWTERPFTTYTFEVVQGEDAVSNVPIPHSALLLGSGLFGLLVVGYRKRTMM